MQTSLRVNVNDRIDMAHLNRLLSEGWKFAAGFAVPTYIAQPSAGSFSLNKTYDTVETSPIALIFLQK